MSALASNEVPDAVLYLAMSQAGATVRAGAAVDWTVRLAGASPASYVFDLELRRDSADGPLAGVTLPKPDYVAPLSDAWAVGWSNHGDNTLAGRLSGVGDAFAVPWSAPFPLACPPEASCLLAAGRIDTTGLPPGCDVLVVRPSALNALRSDVDPSKDAPGDYATRVEPLPSACTVEFDIGE